jgi:SAM-dependent methyltransferase
MAQYDKIFYTELAQSARRSARHIVPIVLGCIKPMSVVDVGCGIGTWLSVFAENGIADYFGIDGDFVPKESLEISPERFVSFDLTRMYKSTRRFDLVVSLEVAEHLPRSCADPFVESLVRLGPVVLFSAAIPGQGGTHHLNEQWQDYWAGLFDQRNYIPIDLIRRTIWENEEVAWWYAQNTFVYCSRQYAATNPLLLQELERNPKPTLSVMHPRLAQLVIWRERLAHGAVELSRVIPPGGAFLLVDDGTVASGFDYCGQTVQFAGSPLSSQAAIEEMNSLCGSVSHLVIVEPAFWWLNFYPEWYDYLCSNAQLVLDTDLLKAFEFESPPYTVKKR